MNATKLRIHTWPDKILKKKCSAVKKVNADTRRILDEMYDLMLQQNGVGLAANQAGLDLQLIVIQVKDRLFRLINPRIIKKQGKVVFSEGCLSFPNLELKIERFEHVWISALNEDGEKVDLEAEGILAVIFQHEIDHINGISFIERVPFLQRVLVRSKLKKIVRTQSSSVAKNIPDNI